MSAHHTSGNVSTSPMAATARVPGLADPAPVGIASFAMTTFVPTSLPPVAGHARVTCGVVAWYLAFAHVVNAAFSRDLVPTWPLS